MFDKAVDEPGFSSACARMCQELANIWVPSSADPTKKESFRKLPICRCQREFEQGRDGSIRFIGELYNFKMLTARIMHECVMKLLTPLTKDAPPDEESLESLCKLLTTTGKESTYIITGWPAWLVDRLG